MKCPECSNEFGSEEALSMHTNAKHSKPYKEPLLSDKAKRGIRNWSIGIVILAVIIGIPVFLSLNSKILPPTTAQGHVESIPESHVMQKPIGVLVQKHLLEHADGEGPAGIIINYNCTDFECEEELIDNLEAFGEKYPENVYVAPYPRMDAKIA